MQLQIVARVKASVMSLYSRRSFCFFRGPKESHSDQLPTLSL